MIECFRCGQEMNRASGCDEDRTIVILGIMYDPIPYGEGYHFDGDMEAEGRCHDCGATVGENHHPGCDMEECPHCGGQYFICDCVTPEKDELWGKSDA